MKFKDQELTIDFQQIVSETKEALRFPKKFFPKLSKKTLKDAVVYYVILSALGALLDIVIGSIFKLIPSMSAVDLISAFIEQVISYTLLSFLFSAVIYGWLKLFKGKGTYRETYLSYAYSRAPIALLGAIPVVSIAATIYSFYLLLIGLHTFHKMTVKRTLLLLLPLFIVFVALGIILFSLVSSSI